MWWKKSIHTKYRILRVPEGRSWNTHLCKQNNQLFLLFAQKLYQVDIETGTSQVLEEGIKQNHFVVSDTKAHAAWLIESGDDAGKIREIEFDSLKTRDISPESGKI